MVYRELFDILPMPDKSKSFIVFDEKIAYTSLGHLHRTQRVPRHENVRYAGATLPMLFAEKITEKVLLNKI